MACACLVLRWLSPHPPPFHLLFSLSLSFFHLCMPHQMCNHIAAGGPGLLLTTEHSGVPLLQQIVARFEDNDTEVCGVVGGLLGQSACVLLGCRLLICFLSPQRLIASVLPVGGHGRGQMRVSPILPCPFLSADRLVPLSLSLCAFIFRPFVPSFIGCRST